MIELEKGNFYKEGNTVYLIGANVPCIGNVFVCKVTKKGKLKNISYLYKYQYQTHFTLCNPIVIDIKYKSTLQKLFCSDFFEAEKRNKLPNIDRFL